MNARRLYDTPSAARELDVPESLIRKWKHRNQVTPADFIRGRGRGGLVPLYDLADLRPLVEQYILRDTPRT